MPTPRLSEADSVRIGVHAAAAFTLAAVTRVALILSFPTIHGGDSSARLAHATTLVLGYQLPVPQAFVAAGKAINDDPLLVRFIFCLWGGVLAAGVAALIAKVWGGRAAGIAAVLLACDPLLIHYSIVPYQEAVAYGLLAWAFYFAPGPHSRIAGCLMAGACLSRYEAWLFLPGFFLATRRKRGPTALALLPVVAWGLWWGGVAPPGMYVLDLDLQANRISRVTFLARKWLEYETEWVALLAGAGCLAGLRDRAPWLLKGVAQFMFAMVVIVSFGHEYPPGSGLMSERLIHLPVLAAITAVSGFLGWIASRSRALAGVALTVTLLIGARGLRFEALLLKEAENQPELALARDVARALDARRSPGECVSVLAPRVDPAPLEAYVAKVRAGSGDVRKARELATSLAGTSPDRDRIAAHLKAPVGTVRDYAGCPVLVVIDAAAPDSAPSGPKRGRLLDEVRAGSRIALIYRTRE